MSPYLVLVFLNSVELFAPYGAAERVGKTLVCTGI